MGNHKIHSELFALARALRLQERHATSIRQLVMLRPVCTLFPCVFFAFFLPGWGPWQVGHYNSLRAIHTPPQLDKLHHQTK